MMDRLARRIVCASSRASASGQLTVVEGAAATSTARARRRPPWSSARRSAWRTLLRGSRGLAEAYFEGCGTRPT